MTLICSTSLLRKSYPLVSRTTTFSRRSLALPSCQQPSKRCFSSVGNKRKKTFLEWYEYHLQNSPVKTKMVTGGLLWGIGDAVAQTVPDLIHSEDNEEEIKEKKDYDLTRTFRAVLFGFGIHAPLSHVHYNFLEAITVRGGFSGLQIPVFKAFMEQFVYWSWISNSIYHGAMAAMQGVTSPFQIYDRIADVLWETQTAQWVFWIPVQLVNFRYVPVRHQLNVVLLTSIAWTALLSAWYPPQENEESNKIQKQDSMTNNKQQKAIEIKK